MSSTVCSIIFFGYGVKKLYGEDRKYGLRFSSGTLSSDYHKRLPVSYAPPYPLTSHEEISIKLMPTTCCCVSTRRDYNPQSSEKEVSKATLIWRAIKLPIYSVALVPLSVGAGAAYLQTGVFSAHRYFLIMASSVLVIAWLNLSNDVYDFDTGADKDKKESVVNLVGSRSGTLLAAFLSLASGCIGLIWMSIVAGNFRAILLLSGAIACGYIYQCPPFRLSYKGLGEPLCFAAFGPFATTAFYFLLGSIRETPNLSVSNTVVLSSFLVGITTTLILFCSHFHQVEGDKAVGKFSPLVRLGTERGYMAVRVATFGLYTLLFISSVSKALPVACTMLCGVTFPMASLVTNYVKDNHSDKDKIFMAKYYCVRLHTLFGVALAAGLASSRHIKPW